MEVFGLRGKFQRTVAVPEQTEVAGVANPFAFDRLKTGYDLLCAVRRAIVQHDHTVGTKCLPCHRLERLAEGFVAVANGDDGKDSGWHQKKNRPGRERW